MKYDRTEDSEIIDSALDTLDWQRREIDRLTAENTSLANGTQVNLWISIAEQEIRTDERDKIAAWLRGMDESTATTLANWLDAGLYNAPVK